jgi:hypothetical protein
MANAVRDLESIVVRQATPEITTADGDSTPPIIATTTASPTLLRATSAAAAASGARASRATSELTLTSAVNAKAASSLVAAKASRPGLNRLTTFRSLAPVDLISEGDVIDVASDYADSRLGEGLDRVIAALGEDRPLTQAAALWLGESDRALELDRAAREVKAASLAKFASDLLKVSEDQDLDALDLLIASAD